MRELLLRTFLSLSLSLPLCPFLVVAFRGPLKELREAVLVARVKWEAAVHASQIVDELAISRTELSNLVKNLTRSGWLPDGGRALTRAFRRPAKPFAQYLLFAHLLGLHIHRLLGR